MLTLLFIAATLALAFVLFAIAMAIIALTAAAMIWIPTFIVKKSIDLVEKLNARCEVVS